MPFLFLLQTGTTQAVVESAAEAANKNLIDILVEGGWPMIPLALLLIGAIYVFIERYLAVRKANTDSEVFMKDVRSYVVSGDLRGAEKLCSDRSDPFSRMIHKGIQRLGRGVPLKDIEASIENVGKLEVIRLERRLPLLATIAGAAPMIGFMGTALGILTVFMKISESGDGTVDPSVLAGGIGLALITTVAGLVVGITAYLGYNILVALVNKVVYKLELTATDFIDLLQEPAK